MGKCLEILLRKAFGMPSSRCPDLCGHVGPGYQKLMAIRGINYGVLRIGAWYLGHDPLFGTLLSLPQNEEHPGHTKMRYKSRGQETRTLIVAKF